MRKGAWVLVGLVALAGCTEGVSVDEPGSTPIEPAALFAHRAAGRVGLDPAWAGLRVGLGDVGVDHAEPTVGVTSDGTVFLSAPNGRVLRSDDGGGTWRDATQPYALPEDLDPWIWVDSSTDRIYNSPLWGGCSWLSWSDNRGDSWELNPAGGCGTPLHHYQKLTTGPPPDGVSTQGYPSLVYYSASSLRNPDPQNPAYLIVAGTGTWITASRDGGRSFPLAVEVHSPTPGCPDSQGSPVAVAPDGTAYSAQNNCGRVRFAATTDGGSTWSVRSLIEDTGYLRFGTEPAVEVDEEGTVYLAYPIRDGRSVLRTSGDGGRTWSAPHVLSPPQVRGTMFTVIAVGARGHVVAAYLATESDPAAWPAPDTSVAPDSATWHLFLTFTVEGLAEAPTFVSVQATPEDNPVQRGCIWMQGGSNPCRNLADFIDVTLHEGRAYVAYADGCGRCSGAADSRGRDLFLARVEEGPSLLGGLLPPPTQ